MKERTSKTTYVLGYKNQGITKYFGTLYSTGIPFKTEKLIDAEHYDSISELLRAMRRGQIALADAESYFIQRVYATRSRQWTYMADGHVTY